MSIGVRLEGVSHSDHNGILQQSMHKKELLKGKGLLSGSIVYTEPFKNYVTESLFFVNNEFGIAMNQNVSFGGTPELIFDGGSGGTEWVGSGPSDWNFSDGGKVVLDHGVNNSEALFTDAGVITTSGYTALTGKVDLDNYTPATQDIFFQFRNSGLNLGDPVSMNNFIDTGDFNEQSFAIPLTEFNLAGVDVNEFTMTVQRSGGHQPHISFDDFQIEQTGTQLKFTAQPPKNNRFATSSLRLVVAAPISGITGVSGATENATITNLAYDKFMGLVLGIGFTVQRVSDNKFGFAGNFKTVGDLLLSGAFIQNIMSDGTNTYALFVTPLSHGLTLDGDVEDRITITINDDMSSLLELSASLIGGRELKQIE